MTTTKGYFVFEKIGPLLFFCYSPKEGTSILLIHEEFHLLYQQLVMLLSTSALSLLQKKPNYDIRELLGSTRSSLSFMPLDTTSSITNLINQCGVNLYYLLRCYHPLLIPSAFRAQIRDIFLRNKRPDTVYPISTFPRLDMEVWASTTTSSSVCSRVSSLSSPSVSPFPRFECRPSAAAGFDHENGVVPLVGGLAARVHLGREGGRVSAPVRGVRDGGNVRFLRDDRQ